MPKLNRLVKRDMIQKPVYYVILGGTRFSRWHVLVSLTEGVIRTKCGKIMLHIDDFTTGGKPDGVVCARCAAE